MPERRIYSSGREPFFNLNSTWYDPAGSWLDTRRKPFHYAHNTCCITGCNRRNDIPRRGGHDYRCYGYRRSTCRPGENRRVRFCVLNPSGGPRDYWGRPIGDSCNGNTGYFSNAKSSSACCGSSGGCGSGGTGVSSQPCSTSVGCSSGGKGVCSELGGCGSNSSGGKRGYSEPKGHNSRRKGVGRFLRRFRRPNCEGC